MRQKLAKQRMQPVTKADGEKMARELGAVKYVECSALTQYKLKDVFDEVIPFFSFCSSPCMISEVMVVDVITRDSRWDRSSAEMTVMKITQSALTNLT